MKHINLLILLIAISMALAFTACSSSDDSDSGGNESEIAPPISIPSNLEAVDLGLPSGTKWANMNVGAYSPEGYGLFFAWGETAGYTSSVSGKTQSDGSYIGYTDRFFEWPSYTNFGTYNASASPDYGFTKYNMTNGPTILEASDDAATANWGSAWRMPTHEEWQELASECFWIWTTSYNGVAGYIVYKVKDAAHKGKRKDSSGDVYDIRTRREDTSFSGSYTTNDTHIFLPAAGGRRESSLNGQGWSGGYWSSGLRSSLVVYAWSLSFYGGEVNADFNGLRWCGQSVRAVCAQ